MDNWWGMLKTFIIPKKNTSHQVNIKRYPKTLALIPTYKPTNKIFNLIADLLVWNPNVKVLIVDDCSPVDSKFLFDKITGFSQISYRIHLIKTPKNTKKAGALNYGLDYLKATKMRPKTVITFDDDVVINEKTINYLNRALQKNKSLGAVCSLVRIKNKNKNS